jgi:hypothetical protein
LNFFSFTSPFTRTSLCARRPKTSAAGAAELNPARKRWEKAARNAGSCLVGRGFSHDINNGRAAPFLSRCSYRAVFEFLAGDRPFRQSRNRR